MSGNKLTEEQKEALCISPVAAVQNLVRDYRKTTQENMGESRAQQLTAAAPIHITFRVKKERGK